MRSRILLISANRCTMPEPVFPLGLACLAAALRQAGHECVWLDRLAEQRRLPAALKQCRPDFVGISLRNIDDVFSRRGETFFDDLPALGATVRKEVGCPIVLGGSGFSLFPERLLALSGADFGIAGEGESGLPALIAALKSGGEYRRIPGLVFRQNGAIIANPPSPTPLSRRLTDADRPPRLTARYVRLNGTLNLQTQRGCSFRCCYCTYPLLEGRRHRCRPPELVADEFEQLERSGARYAFVVDSVFNSTPRHVTEVCEALLRRNLKLPWGCFLRPQALTPELMRLMARAGLAHIEFGSDSFCDEVLAAYHKDFTFDDILRSSQLARQANINFCHFLIAGGPGETRATLARAFENSKRLGHTVILAAVGMRIYPGTTLFEQAVAEGRLRREADLLRPAYYFGSDLTAAGIRAQLEEFARRSPNWLVSEPDPAYRSLVARMRRRGLAGPLWSYFSMIRRLQPQRLAGRVAASGGGQSVS